MATNGTIQLTAADSNLSFNESVTFKWELVSQSPANNTSTISWSFTAQNGESILSCIYFAYRINIGSTTIVLNESANITVSPGTTKVIAQGTSTISHNANGTLFGTMTVGAVSRWGANITQSHSGSASVTFPTISRGAKVLTADNFTDEDNPTITYSNPAGSGATLLQACISFTGGDDDIPYMDISKTGSSYTFNLTDDERNTLRLAAVNAQSITVRFYVKVTVGGTTYWDYVDRTFTVVNCNPIVDNPTVKDIKPETLALTGDENTVVRYESMVEYGFEVTAMKSATIVSQGVQCGNKIVTGLAQGVIDDVESNLFVFSATDSRGLTTTATVEKNLVDYVKPTCYQTITTELVGETGAKVDLTISGNYFNGSFGLTDNTLKLEVRHTQNDGTMGDWVDLTDGLIPTFNGNTYELDIEISGFDYSQSYTFQCRATDKLNYVESAQYVVKVLPVFDWDNDDFNFNVPVNMNGETVLRHNAEAGNTVLSGSGGHIYLRPKGTNSTSNETIFNPDGSVDFKGPVRVDGEEVLVGEIPQQAADYVVDYGSTSMGSNGTWYWEKWNSGKAVCWGTRNYGRLAVTSTYSNTSGYYSSSFQQTFPSGLFNAAPSFTAANMACYDDDDDTRWQASRSMVSASSMYLSVRSAMSITLPSSYISIHAIGRWK